MCRVADGGYHVLLFYHASLRLKPLARQKLDRQRCPAIERQLAQDFAQHTRKLKPMSRETGDKGHLRIVRMLVHHKMFVRAHRVHARHMLLALQTDTRQIGVQKMFNLALIVRVNILIESKRIAQLLASGVSPCPGRCRDRRPACLCP